MTVRPVYPLTYTTNISHNVNKDVLKFSNRVSIVYI